MRFRIHVTRVIKGGAEVVPEVASVIKRDGTEEADVWYLPDEWFGDFEPEEGDVFRAWIGKDDELVCLGRY